MVTILGIAVILKILITFLEDCNESKAQGPLIIFDHPRNGNLPRDGDGPKDGSHHR